LPSEISVLDGFDAVDEICERVERGGDGEVAIDSSTLGLGPLAEILVMRRAWRVSGRKVSLTGEVDARRAAIAEVTRSPVAKSSHSDSTGACHVIGTGANVETLTNEFVSLTGRLALEAGMPETSSRLLKGVFGELIDNIWKHAGVGAKGLAAYSLDARSIFLVVADAGQGVVQGYIEAQPQLAGLTAAQALEWAVRLNKSRFTQAGHGTGFAGLVKAMRVMDAALRVRSDDASIEIEGPADSADWLVRDQPGLQGFVVSLHLKW